jgi:iron complex outermembrane receptor protein
MKRYLLLLLMILASGFSAYSQTINGYEIKGKVTDINGSPLVGASVTIAGTFTGVRTGVNGIYSIAGFDGGEYTVRFSFVGYETKTISIAIYSDTILDAELTQMAVVTDDVIISATRAGNKAPLAYTNVSGDILERLN